MVDGSTIRIHPNRANFSLCGVIQLLPPIELVDTDIPGDGIQIAIAIHIPQRHGAGIVGIGGDIGAADSIERVGAAVVEIELVGLISSIPMGTGYPTNPVPRISIGK